MQPAQSACREARRGGSKRHRADTESSKNRVRTGERATLVRSLEKKPPPAAPEEPLGGALPAYMSGRAQNQRVSWPHRRLSQPQAFKQQRP